MAQDTTATTTTATAATATAAAIAKKDPPKREAVVLLLTAEGIEPLRVGKYPMPVKAPRFPLSVNGQDVDAATTAFKDMKYTYFVYQGVSFWVTGHLNPELGYTLDFPDGYEFKPVKVDRKAQAAAANTAPASEESALGASEADGEGADSVEASEAPTAAPVEAPKGKKAKR